MKRLRGCLGLVHKRVNSAASAAGEKAPTVLRACCAGGLWLRPLQKSGNKRRLMVVWQGRPGCDVEVTAHVRLLRRLWRLLLRRRRLLWPQPHALDPNRKLVLLLLHLRHNSVLSLTAQRRKDTMQAVSREAGHDSRHMQRQ